MSITINGAVSLTLSEVTRTVTTTRDDNGSATTLSYSGRTLLTGSGIATQAATLQRRLTEIAANSQLRALHVANSQETADDGLYDLTEASVETGQTTAIDGLVQVRLSLRRLGGAGASGSNITRTAYPSVDLQTNSYAITAINRWALPAGSKSIGASAVGNSAGRASVDGSVPIKTASATSPQSYILSGADYEAGECRIYDTGGSATESDWQRVFSPDHTFANPAHLVISNSLVRYTPLASGNQGSHKIEVYAGSAWTTATDATAGDALLLGSASVTDAWAGVRIDELSNWRVKVTWLGSRTTAPAFYTKSITLDRGRYLALYEITTGSSSNIYVGATGSALRYVVSADDARDHTVEASAANLTTTTDNWLATWTGAAATTMIVGAARSSSTATFTKTASGGFQFRATSATALAVYLGAVPYDAGKSRLEAESGTASGGASFSTDVGSYSGTGTIKLDAVSERISFPTLASPPAGTDVTAWFRVLTTSAAAADAIKIQILKSSDGSELAADTLVANVAADFPSGFAWVWRAVTYSSWDGTTAIHPSVVCTVRGGTANFHIDQCAVLTVRGGTALAYPNDLGEEALSEIRVWQSISVGNR